GLPARAGPRGGDRDPRARRRAEGDGRPRRRVEAPQGGPGAVGGLRGRGVRDPAPREHRRGGAGFEALGVDRPRGALGALMTNVLMLSPGYPAEMPGFPRGLARVGARVYGIGDQPAGALDARVKEV